MELEGKVAVVTGGGSGIGETICRRLADEGARVGVLDIDEGLARLTAELVGGAAVQADVSDSGSVDKALARLEAELGPVDVWVNNAGIPAVEQAERINPLAERQLEEARDSGEITTPLEGLVRLPDDEWRRMLAIHLDGTFFGTRAAARSMTARGAGSIVNMASICGIEGCAGHPHYSAAKAGILGLTRAVAKELAVQGVRVNLSRRASSRSRRHARSARSSARQRDCGRRLGASRARRRWRRQSPFWPATSRRSSSARL